MSGMTAEVDKMEQVWSSIDELCSSLSGDDWNRPTDCPGWTVKDQLSHLAGAETLILGRPQPALAEVTAGHVKNPVGALNEAHVQARRPLPPERVLEEWRELVGERLKLMRSWSDEDWDALATAVLGEMRHRDMLPFRILDAWMHEQDIRRAVGRPGHTDGEVARHVWNMMSAGMPFVVGKRVAPPDGTVVFFNVSGGPAGTFAVAMESGRGKVADATQTPTTGLTMSFETFVCLTAGRWSAERALAEGGAQISGDQDLGRRVLENMVVVP